MHVLLLEPDRQLSRQYAEALQEHGHDVRIVHQPQDAIEEVDNVKPDVIILELLNGMHNGVEFLYELRSYADCSEISIILQTFVQPERFTSDESLLSQLGIEEYLYKPSATLTQLQQAVHRLERRILT